MKLLKRPTAIKVGVTKSHGISRRKFDHEALHGFDRAGCPYCSPFANGDHVFAVNPDTEEKVRIGAVSSRPGAKSSKEANFMALRYIGPVDGSGLDKHEYELVGFYRSFYEAMEELIDMFVIERPEFKYLRASK